MTILDSIKALWEGEILLSGHDILHLRGCDGRIVTLSLRGNALLVGSGSLDCDIDVRFASVSKNGDTIFIETDRTSTIIKERA